MLKNIPQIISPDLLKILAEMGHGDEIVIADGNFPSANMGQRVVYMLGNGGCDVLKAVLELLPLDSYEKPVYLIDKVKGDNVDTPIWDEYREIVSKYTDEEIQFIERFDFYERARKAYAVIATGETALYGCMILKKGVIRSDERKEDA